MKEPELIDVEMPDGTVITDVPAGTSQSEVMRRYSLSQRPIAPPMTPAENILRGNMPQSGPDLAEARALRKNTGSFGFDADPNAQLRAAQERQLSNLPAGLATTGAIALGGEAAPVVGPILGRVASSPLAQEVAKHAVKRVLDVAGLYGLNRLFGGRPLDEFRRRLRELSRY
jgi:hypothetical protein